MSETLGRLELPAEEPSIDGYTSWPWERKENDKQGGGLTMIYRKDLSVHRHTPTVPPHLEYLTKERQWLLIGNGTSKIAFLHCYLACQTTRNNNYIKWNEDLFGLMADEAKLLKLQGFTILALGDFNSRIGRVPGLEFNTPDTNDNAPMFLNFINVTNLVIINTLPIAKGQFTWFMNRTGRQGPKSLLDYGLIDHTSADSVTSFAIDENARFAAGSDHALLECSIVLRQSPKIKWSFHDSVQYKINDNTNYEGFTLALDEAMKGMPVLQFSRLSASEMLPYLTDNIKESARTTLGLRVRKKKRGRKLPTEVIQIIKDKNKLSQQIANKEVASEADKKELSRLQERLFPLFTDIYTSYLLKGGGGCGKKLKH